MYSGTLSILRTANQYGEVMGKTGKKGLRIGMASEVKIMATTFCTLTYDKSCNSPASCALHTSLLLTLCIKNYYNAVGYAMKCLLFYPLIIPIPKGDFK